MTLERVTRAAVEDLWAHTVADPEQGLTDLFAAHTRRRTQSRWAMGLAVAAAVLAAWWGGTTFGHHAATPQPAPPVPVPTQVACPSGHVRCLGQGTYRFALASPVVWRIPRGFGVDSGGGATSGMVESYWHHRGIASGVTVLEGVRAAARTAHPAPAPGVPGTAAGFVQWLASHSYLHASTPRRTTVAGHPAWAVRVSLNPHAAPGPATCTGGNRCYPVTIQSGDSVTGIWGDMVADYTAFDLPGSGTAVVWSWSFAHDTSALTRNRELVAGLSWPRH